MAKDAPASKEKSDQNQKISIKGTEQIMHHLYVLKSVALKKNISWTEEPIYEEIQHQHMFHSCDSSGLPQKNSSPVGGHFHVIELVKGENGTAPRAVCSTPKKMIRNKRGQRIMVDFNPEDLHTHPVEYRHSEVLKPRILNPEAAKHQAHEAKKEAPIPGIQG